jgi:hypothetical protein
MLSPCCSYFVYIMINIRTYTYNIYIYTYIYIHIHIHIHIHRQAHSVKSHDAMVKTWVNNSASGELSSIHGYGVMSFYSVYIYIYISNIYPI